MFCKRCGRPIDGEDKVCPLCHEPVGINTDDNVKIITNADEKTFNNVHKPTEDSKKFDVAGVNVPNISNMPSNEKSRTTAGFLQIFLGALGTGRFYLGYAGIGILQVAVSLVTCGVGGFVWGFVDGLRILDGYPEKDASGNALK